MSHSRQGNGARVRFALLILAFLTPILFVAHQVSAQSYLYRFAVIGDYGNNSATEAAVAAMVKTWNPSFILTTGDNNYVNGEAATIDNNIGQHYGEFIGNYQGRYGDGSPTIRFFPSLGNHDWLTTGARPYLDYFTLPGNERYYDFVRGDVHFFALDSDSNEPDGATATSVQGNWLRTRLAASTAKWQVVYFHHPPYTSSATHSPTTRMRWPFQEWGADVVLSGHVHEYERLDINGLTYLVNGLGGASRYGAGTPVAGSLVRYSAAVGAQLVTVYDCKMVFEFYSVMGGSTLIDSYTLGTCGTTTNPTATRTANPTTVATTAPTAAPTNSANQLTVIASADAYVDSVNSQSNAGNSTSIRVDASPILRSYLRFTVPAVSGTITRAVLRVYARSTLGSSFSLASTTGSWSESTITYANAPSLGTTIGRSPTANAESWVDIDVSSLVKSAGQYNLVMFTSSTTAASFHSRENINAPRLILSLGSLAGNTAPTPIPTVIAPSTQTPIATLAPSGGSVTLNPVADSYVHSDSSASNFGTNASLRTDASPTMRSYMRFDVPNSGTVLSATLRLYSTSSNPTGYTVQRSSNTWDEMTLTYNNAPAPSGSYGTSGALSANTWREVNLSSLITGAGQYSIVVSSTSSTTTAFASRETSYKPQLVIVYATSASSINSAESSLAMPIEAITAVSTETAVVLPTETPIVLPTNTAIVLPTETATVLPTNTALPTALPSNTAVPPTAVPTAIPTALPTETPILVPTEAPTSAP
jgi:tartrate-resistant acid phosphatase type 5